MAGVLVRTKSGKTGIVNNNDPLINGKCKVRVIRPEKENLLCDPETLTVIGYVD